MAVNLTIPETASIHGVRGVRIGIAEAGIRYANRKDLTVLVLDEGTSVAGVFTKNRFCAAPVQVCQQHLDSTNGKIRALVINTGNANAGTGEPGLQHARTTCQEVAQALNIEPNAVLPFSTGVIMEPLPIQKISAGIPVALANLKDNAWFDAAHAIMTTDTLPKIYSQKIQVQQETVTVTGVSKGAGMIRPNMATMLGYLATDAGIAPAVLKTMALEIANQSFNRITVDGDTSTNDSFILMATGKTAWTIDSSNHPAYAEVLAALTKAAKDLAQKIVRDAEGATKFMTIQVDSARNSAEALAVAYSIAHSPLVKTAFYASDPNLGRILAAIGYAGIDDLDTNHVALWLNEVAIAKGGMVHPDYNESKGKTVMQQAEIVVRVDLGRGQSSDTVYTCDFSHEYVSINADYRS